ncbi:3,4-dihydroxy-2-butanone-4-phosphate synthase [Haloglomus litoreum]|uniref:3,4-dihydroxy-2-butanone-4-phosphate synthase n=1 Tax=Haloglomus litoreum TaxID=3034026 RepID=UPI0023E887B6|nr:3,4-dihydroxy-2-butanone-4-phosphate synthase [Haloglomus sp. DT116]
MTRADADTDAGSAPAGADPVEAAIEAFQAGEPVLVHDAADREGETDLVYPAAAVDPAAVARMRNDAGGLVCTAVSHDVAERLDLPFLQESIDHPLAADHELAYDERSSFSLTVNHRETFTGITDEDRALTIRELGRHATDPDPEAFAESFRAPGHVHLLRAAPDLLADREGHTELGIALADAAGTEPAVVVCEMLDDETGGARSPVDARRYADRHDLVYVEGADLLAALR